ncbi:riboflavin kinase [Auriculariales sp. MPI-PUGE-AT-0066]|nr:riboflavin kinase [Auriculariales sp. MPI-PUGE-AT-0066]
MATAQQQADLDHRPIAPISTGRAPRPEIVGADVPEAPYPIHLRGAVQKGFGRGSKELGFPTANLPDDSLEPLTSMVKTGIYFGYAQLVPEPGESSPFQGKDLEVLPMVMSLGFNPFYNNEKMTAEVHVLHKFAHDFYGHEIRVIVLGYIRPELDYISREALIDDINTDISVGLRSLDRDAYSSFARDGLFAL